MGSSRHTTTPSGNRAVVAVATAGLIAGSLDIASAFVLAGMKGRTPTWLLQYVASGLVGAQAFSGGFATAALGALLHFLIAMGAAAVFYVSSRKLRILTERPVVGGLAYGVAVHAFMNLIVLPLSAATVRPTVSGVVTQLIIHMLLIGLPISLIMRRSHPCLLPNYHDRSLRFQRQSGTRHR
ncbi:MAG: hypothetical protein H0X73_01045 [Chthoniobacterales bacterium]|nr:hypothetical protein [Chthoniobacterales bacterium]